MEGKSGRKERMKGRDEWKEETHVKKEQIKGRNGEGRKQWKEGPKLSKELKEGRNRRKKEGKKKE